MSYDIGKLRIEQQNSQLDIQIIVISVFAALAVFFFVIFIVVVSVLCHKYKLKGQQNDRLLYELERLETSVAHECKLGERDYTHWYSSKPPWLHGPMGAGHPVRVLEPIVEWWLCNYHAMYDIVLCC